MKKQITAMLLTFVLLLLFFPAPAHADSVFIDVAPTHWGAAYIDQCCRLGLMVGTSANTFEPNGDLTVAQLITAAVRLREHCTGDVGELQQTGENWYDSAIQAAAVLGILTDGEFDSYTRPATRAELAGILGKALPADEYKPINNVDKLPDVDSSTPYADEIFMLYEAGILTGNDAYGTFSPYQNISRAELAALMCRLAEKDTRVTFTLLPKPADTTVRTTACRLIIAGIPVYGVVEIDGKYYMPIEILDSRNRFPSHVILCDTRTEGTLALEIRPSNLHDGDTVLRQEYAAPAGIEMGKAEPSALRFLYNTEELKDALYTIGGRYPMVSLEAIGAKREGNDFIIYPDAAKGKTIQYEEDLIGNIPSQLKRNSTRETVIAIHDYIVNTLTYDPRVGQACSTQEQRLAVEELWQKMEEIYTYENNICLATGYGVCQNYAELFQAMCHRLGIPNILVSGSAGGGGHTWNMVHVDSEWLYVDCTWDDPISWEPQLLWNYCLVDADQLVSSHAWNGDDYPMPKEYDPAWEQLDPNNITSADMFRKCLVAQMMQKKTSFQLKTTAAGAYGGIGCIHYYSYEIGWCWFSGGYNAATCTYDYEVEYWY